ncbi:MAG: hypothetical protein EXR68_07055 [Dehalococcoidia bacterium]|nr:hypothetical protein [Dehalococcoidia bacterium]
MARAFARNDHALIAASIRTQIAAGAEALDLNFGIDPPAAELPWVIAVARDAAPGVPLWIDAARPASISVALEACARDSIAEPFVVNSLAVGGETVATDEALLHAAASASASLVISPQRVGYDGPADGEVEHVLRETSLAADRALSIEVSPPFFVDALVYPALHHPAGVRRSLALIRAYGRREDVVPLAVVGNIAFGAPRELASRLRAVYAAAATGVVVARVDPARRRRRLHAGRPPRAR